MTRYACALGLAALLVGCGKSPSTTNEPVKDGTRLPEVPITGFKKLETQDIEPGKGEPVKKGDTVMVFYFGKFVNGTIFDSNMDEKYVPILDKEPYPVIVGAGGVIKGWDEGLVGTREGTIRKINVPYAMAYGAEGDGGKIPPKSDLIFVCKIAKVYHQGVAPEIVATDIKKGTGKPVSKDSVVTFRYVGKMLSGKVFDDQMKAMSMPWSKLIPGFNEVILGMKPGGERKMSWPPGSPNPTGQIPGNQPVEYTIYVDAVK